MCDIMYGVCVYVVSKMFVARCTSSFVRRNVRAAVVLLNFMDMSN